MGTSVVSPRCAHVGSMVFTRCLHGASVVCPWLGLWCFRGASVVRL